MNRSRRPGKFPRVQNLNPGPDKIFGVAGCDHETVSDRCGCQQRIHIRQPIVRTQTSPNLSFIKTNLKNPAHKNRHDFRQRFFENKRLCRIFGADFLYPSAYFPHRKDTQIMRFRRVMKKPCADARIRPATFANFANHVGIDEKHGADVQSSSTPWSRRGGLALRGSLRSKSQSFSPLVSPVPEICSKLRTRVSFAVFSSCPNASCKIRRCSSSAETPCSAACCLSLFASASGIFLTSNWAIH